MTALLATDIPPIPCTIDGLLYHGHVVLAGPAKLGKSFLGLQLASAVSSGYSCLGSRRVLRSGPVMSLCLEDGKARFKHRAQTILGQQATEPWLDSWQVIFELTHTLDAKDGLDDLRRALDQTRYELVLVDTLVKAFASTGPSDLFKGEYDQLDKLTKLARDYDCSIVTIAHTRKPGRDEDVSALAMVAGTGGRIAAVDSIMVLSGRQGADTANLDVISRDHEAETIKLKRQSTGAWLEESALGAVNPLYSKR